MSETILFGLGAAALVGLGLYGFIIQPEPLRKLLAFNLLGSGVFLLFGVIARRGGRDGWRSHDVPRREHRRLLRLREDLRHQGSAAEPSPEAK